MKKILLIFILISELSFSQNIFLGTSSGQLWKTSPITCNAILIGSCPTFVDIAFLPNGKLYGQTWSAIYEVDTNTAASTLVMTVSSGNSLVGASNGMLYAVSGTTLREIDVVNSTSTILGNVTCSSGGDLAYFNGELYLACGGNNLLKINITNPGASIVVGNMAISGAAYGLVNAVNGCTENPYVISSSGLLYPLNYNTAAVGSSCNMGNSGSVYGAASPNEFAGGGGQANLLGNDSILCNNPALTFTLPIVPNTIFLWSDNSTNNSFTANVTGKYWVDVTDTSLGCVFTDTVNLTFITNNVNDTTLNICIEQNVDLLSYINPPVGSLWYDQSFNTTPTILYLTSGSYVFNYVTNGTCIDTASVTVNVLYDSLKIGNDTTICIGESLVYGIQNIPTLTYMWEDGFNQSSKPITSTGKYYLIATDNVYGCILSDTAEATVLAVPNAGNGTNLNLCDYNGVDFFNYLTGSPESTGTWYNNDGSIITMPINQSKLYNGPYSYIVNNGYCTDTSYINATNVFADLTGFEYFPNLIYTEQTEVDFMRLSSGDSVKWTVDNILLSQNDNFTYKFNTNGFKNVCMVLYTNNCIDSICDVILVRDEISIYVPNSFTPNNDGFNDVISPSIAGDIEDYKFYIFNRWGEQFFETHTISDTWDGTHENEKVSIGVYAWRLTYKIPNTTDFEALSGYFMLIK